MWPSFNLDSESENEPLPSRYYRLAWKLTSRVVRWIKAIGALLLMAGGTLTTTYGLAEVQDFVRTIFGSKVYLPTLVVGVTVAYLALTILLKLPKGFSASNKLDDGE